VRFIAASDMGAGARQQVPNRRCAVSFAFWPAFRSKSAGFGGWQRSAGSLVALTFPHAGKIACFGGW